jgi:hypothetical protein
VSTESGGSLVSVEELIEFHSERAMTELDQALTARDLRAAQAHFGLSSLHLDRMRSLQDSAPRSRTVVGH